MTDSTSYVAGLADAAPEQVWTPDPRATSGLTRFGEWAAERTGRSLPDYAALHEWSVSELEEFWSAVADWFGVRFHERPTGVLGARSMPGAEWFPGATLNYAEQALADEGAARRDGDPALVFVREDGQERSVSYGELRAEVARARAGLVALGVGRGARVVALAPNCVQTLVAFLATASLGAVWSSCSPDFGSRAVRDRFVQVEPTVFLAVDGYTYGGRTYGIRGTIDELRQALPATTATVLIPYLDPDATLDGARTWDWLTGHDGPLTFEPVPFGHPLWILYSSGTTGLPKGIVHSHGGIVVEHLKAVGLHLDVGPGDRLFWFTTTGWMMWNFLVGGLLVGTTVVLYDGSPAHPDLSTLWRLAVRHRITVLGVSAGYLHTCLKQGLRPRDAHDVGSIKVIGSTGSPLSPDGFRWVSDAVGPHVQTVSTSGGTDVCAPFLGGAPTVPVWLGELSCAALGAAVHTYDEHGRELIDEVGELVIIQPMPSMPISLWNDPDGTRLREAYFDVYPGVWRHGDWIKLTPRGSAVVYGRSDSTLNRGGVRMGTAEFYDVVEGFDEVLDSLVIDTTRAGPSGDATEPGELLCFVVLVPGAALSEVEPRLRAALRRELSPRHLPDRFEVIKEVPRTLSGKKCEVPVRRILAGEPAERAVSADALANPRALDHFLEMRRR